MMFGKRVLGLMMGSLLTLVMGSCVLAADTVKAPAVIESFTASSTVIQSGETVMLDWNVTGDVAYIDLVGIEKKTDEVLPLKHSIEVWPMATTSYILLVKGQDGNVVSKSVTVCVDIKGEVKIDSFKASTTKVYPGQPVLLLWKVSNGVTTKVTCIVSADEKQNECLPARPIEGTLDVYPKQTTTYLLEATGFNGEVVSDSITVNVIAAPQPKVLTFTATQTEVSRGDLVTISWTTENAVSCSILTSDGLKLVNRKPNGSISITPNTTKTYKLIAYGVDGTQATSELTIKVK